MTLEKMWWGQKEEGAWWPNLQVKAKRRSGGQAELIRVANWRMVANWKGIGQMEGENMWEVVAKWKVRSRGRW